MKLPLLLLIPFLQTITPPTTIPPNDSRLRYEGRTLSRNNATELSWPGTSVTIRFKGTGVSALLKDQDTANYYNVIVNGKVTAILHPNTTLQTYQLATNLPNSIHTVTLFKRTEWDKGKTYFYGFQLSPKATIQEPPPLPKRKMLFYGNSITCGYAVEDSTGDSYTGYFENNYASYAAITARHFNTQYQCIAKSGIGILVSWFPLIMPEMYDRTDATDATSKWNFAKYQPNIVVINLFQNDSWLVEQPDHPQFKARFGTQKPSPQTITQAYKKFIQTLRTKHPNATFICALGSMDATRPGSPWPGYITQAVKQINDPNIFTHFFPNTAQNGHPKIKEQQAMADDLIQYIHKKLKW